MKNIITLELFGENTRQLFKLYRRTFELFGYEHFFDENFGVPSRSIWVAEITGPDDRYRLARSFLRGKFDYSHANGVGSRGILVEYILSSGHIYEVQEQISWKSIRRYFCTVDAATGEIVELSEEHACHAVGAETAEERRNRRRAEKLSEH